MSQDHNAPPLNPLPPVVWLLALPVIAMELVLNLGAGGWLAGRVLSAGDCRRWSGLPSRPT